MNQNNKLYSLWLDEKNYKKLEIESKKAGLYKSNFLRKLINDEKIKPRNCEHHAEMLRKIAGIGNNANQLAHKANFTGTASKSDIDEMFRLIKEAYILIMDKW